MRKKLLALAAFCLCGTAVLAVSCTKEEASHEPPIGFSAEPAILLSNIDMENLSKRDSDMQIIIDHSTEENGLFVMNITLEEALSLGVDEANYQEAIESLIAANNLLLEAQAAGCDISGSGSLDLSTVKLRFARMEDPEQGFWFDQYPVWVGPVNLYDGSKNTVRFWGGSGLKIYGTSTSPYWSITITNNKTGQTVSMKGNALKPDSVAFVQHGPASWDITLTKGSGDNSTTTATFWTTVL